MAGTHYDEQTNTLLLLHDTAARTQHGIRTRKPCLRAERLESRFHPALSPQGNCRRLRTWNAKYASSRAGWCSVKNILVQLAHSTLLPDDLAKPILAGDTPPVENIVKAVVIGCMDAYFVTVNDAKSSWPEKRAARMALAVAFLGAMATLGEGEA